MRRHSWGKYLLLLLLLLAVAGCRKSDDQSIAFQESFDDPRGGWPSGQTPEFTYGYGDKDYSIAVQTPNWFGWATPGRQFADVSIEVDVRPAPDSQDGHFGVLCRHVNVRNFYYFAISDDGYYAIFRRLDGGPLTLLNWGGGMLPSQAIRPGGESNHLLAVCQGEELSFYINGELVAIVNDDALARGDIGLGAGSGPDGLTHALFDDLLVSRP